MGFLSRYTEVGVQMHSGQIAQLVERTPEKREVVGSIPTLTTRSQQKSAELPEETHPAKVKSNRHER
jgi:hypothetical protein